MNDLKRGSPETANTVEAARGVVGSIFHRVAGGRPHPTSNSLLQLLRGKITPMRVLTYVVTCWECTGRNSADFLENTTLPCGREGGRERNSNEMTVTPLELQAWKATMNKN